MSVSFSKSVLITYEEWLSPDNGVDDDDVAVVTDESQYLDLVRTILNRGSATRGRNGSTKCVFGTTMRFSLLGGTMPLLTTKRVAWKTCFKELLWFIRGSTNVAELQRDGVHIWDGNSTREFLDARGLSQYAEGDVGPVYGHQWRHFGAPYVDCHTDYSGQGVDQLQYIIDQLKTVEGRTSRRLVLSSWNPAQLDAMALPPCHVLVQFHVRDNAYLSCALYQRSGDVGLGLPFNIASYSFLTHLLAAHCGLVAEEFVYVLGNAHIYEEHEEALRQQLTRTPVPFPKLSIDSIHPSIENYGLDDIRWVEPYVCEAAIPMKMIP
jgi:thymidylate synthase